jgi:hypothetical protein
LHPEAKELRVRRVCRPLLDGGRGGGEGSVRHLCHLLVEHAQAIAASSPLLDASSPLPHPAPQASPAPLSASTAAGARARTVPTMAGRHDGQGGEGGARGGDGGGLAVGGGGGAGGATGALCARDLPKTRPCHTSLPPHVFAFAENRHESQENQENRESLGLERQDSCIEQHHGPGTGIEQNHRPGVEFYDARDPSPLRV